MSEKKTHLPSLGRRTVKFETEKMNNLLTNILTNNITELNDLIYAGAKLVRKIGVFLKTIDRKSKPGWELRLESQIKKNKTKTTNNNTKTEHLEVCGRYGKSTT